MSKAKNFLMYSLSEQLKMEDENRGMENFESSKLNEIMSDRNKTIDFVNNFYEILDWETIITSELIDFETFAQLDEEVVREILSDCGCEFITNYKTSITNDFVRRYFDHLPVQLIVGNIQLEPDLQEKIFNSFYENYSAISLLIRNQRVLSDPVLAQFSNLQWYNYLKENEYVPMTLDFFKKWEEKIFNDEECIRILCRKNPLTIEICREYFDQLDFFELGINRRITDEKVKALIAMNLSL